eukprot:Em0012g157a
MVVSVLGTARCNGFVSTAEVLQVAGHPEWLDTQSGWTPRVAGHPEWLVTQSGWSPRVAGHPEWLVTQSGWTSHSSDTMQRSTPALSVPVKVFDKATQKLDDVHSFMKSCLYVSRRHNDMWTIVWEYSDLEPGRNHAVNHRNHAVNHRNHAVTGSHLTVIWDSLLASYLDEVIAHYNSFRRTVLHLYRRSYQVQLSTPIPALQHSGKGEKKKPTADVCNICKDYFQQLFDQWYAGSMDIVWTLQSLLASHSCAGSIDYFQELFTRWSIDDGTCEDYFQQLFTRQCAGSIDYFQELFTRWYAGSIDDGTCEDYFQQLFTRQCAGSIDYFQELFTRWYAGSIDDGTCEEYFQQLCTRQCAGSIDYFQELFTRWYAGSIDDGTCEDYFQQLCTRQYAGSIDDGTCEEYFQQLFTQWYAGSIDVVWTLRSLLASHSCAGAIDYFQELFT